MPHIKRALLGKLFCYSRTIFIQLARKTDIYWIKVMTLRENDLFMSKARSNAIIFVKIRTLGCKGKYTLFINRLSNPTFVYRLTGCFLMKGYLFEGGINEKIITKLYNIIKDVFFFP